MTNLNRNLKPAIPSTIDPSTVINKLRTVEKTATAEDRDVAVESVRTKPTQVKSGQDPICDRKSMSEYSSGEYSDEYSEMYQPADGTIREIALCRIKPSPENEKLYKPVDPADPEVRALADSTRRYGIREPLVITLDGWLLSGHRRYVAAGLAGLEYVPCRIEPFYKRADPDRFLRLLREYNRQRTKSFNETWRESVVSTNPEESYHLLQEHRRLNSQPQGDFIQIHGTKTRARISKAKEPFLNVAITVINELKEFWPVSDRKIHYELLNNPPLIHASKADSVYRNHPSCYKALTDLLTRARLAGRIPFHVISDPTRPVSLWSVHSDPAPFLRAEMDGLFNGYYRNLQQSQPNHLEIVGEKNTVEGIIKPVAMEYRIPLTIGRGFCSLDPRHQIARRYQQSGKEHLILLVLSDFDPEGEEICQSLARSMRDDFGIEKIKAVKVALTAEQVRRLELPANQMEAKKTSANYEKFVARYGTDVYELEAVAGRKLQELLRGAINSVLDTDLYNREVEAEKQDAASLEVTRRKVQHLFKELGSL